MRVFNEDKTLELKIYDTEVGMLKRDTLFVKHHPAVKEKAETGHYEVVKTYNNGGKDVKWVVDTPYVAPRESYDGQCGSRKCKRDEYEDILVFVPYSDKQLAEIEIAKLKRNLADTDYKAIKYSEGLFTEEEYEPIRVQRQEWRERINTLQETYFI